MCAQPADWQITSPSRHPSRQIKQHQDDTTQSLLGCSASNVVSSLSSPIVLHSDDSLLWHRLNRGSPGRTICVCVPQGENKKPSEQMRVRAGTELIARCSSGTKKKVPTISVSSRSSTHRGL